jgi:hypothetical protein
MNTTEIETEFTPDELAAAMSFIVRQKRAASDLRSAAAAVLATAYDCSIPPQTGEPCFALVYRGEQKHLSGVELADRDSGEKFSIWVTNGANWVPARLMPESGGFVGEDGSGARFLATYETAGALEIFAPGPGQLDLVKRAIASMPRDENGLLFSRVMFSTHAEELILILDAIGWDSRDKVASACRAKLAKSKAATPSQSDIAEQIAKLRISLGETL